MAFTYSGDPSTDDKDEVRFLIQDTDQEEPLLQDEEITFLLTFEGSPVKAAANAAERIATKFAREVDTTVGPVKEMCSQKHEQYLKIAKKLKDLATNRTPIPYAGGISIADKETVRRDADRVSPAFNKHLHEADRRDHDDDDDLRGATC